MRLVRVAVGGSVVPGRAAPRANCDKLSAYTPRRHGPFLRPPSSVGRRATVVKHALAPIVNENVMSSLGLSELLIGLALLLLPPALLAWLVYAIGRALDSRAGDPRER
jgi:hypothetical protein